MTKSILQKIIDTPDDQLRDDDHLHRPGLSVEDARQGFKELAEKFKDQKPKRPKSNEFAQGIINVLNDPSIADD
jgi:hypothetical protein